mmetsp:Transcript_5178/g.17158  ORF Transcript_5178/g.17158 Transcript_5178/m.17158 type:complete len:286 (+) Transcript_5178:1981-2838(+)
MPALVRLPVLSSNGTGIDDSNDPSDRSSSTSTTASIVPLSPYGKDVRLNSVAATPRRRSECGSPRASAASASPSKPATARRSCPPCSSSRTSAPRATWPAEADAWGVAPARAAPSGAGGRIPARSGTKSRAHAAITSYAVRSSAAAARSSCISASSSGRCLRSTEHTSASRPARPAGGATRLLSAVASGAPFAVAPPASCREARRCSKISCFIEPSTSWIEASTPPLRIRLSAALRGQLHDEEICVPVTSVSGRSTSSRPHQRDSVPQTWWRAPPHPQPRGLPIR